MDTYIETIKNFFCYLFHVFVKIYLENVTYIVKHPVFRVDIQSIMVVRHIDLLGFHGKEEGVQNIMAAIYRTPPNTFSGWGFRILWL